MNSSFKKLSKPYVIWLYIFALFPVAIMFVLMFFSTEGVSTEEATFSLEHFLTLFESSTIQGFVNSVKFAMIATAIIAVLGYFLAYRIVKSRFKNKFLILTILILPMWSNLLLRIEALGNIMEANNILTNMFGIQSGISIKGTEFAVILGLVFTYLPFMVLPIYSALEKIDISVEEAALDLGVTEMTKFWKVIFPLSIKGVVTGSILVFLPCFSGFAIPDILGKGNILTIGNIIERSFRNMNYNFGSILAVIIIILILGSLFLVNKVDKEGETLL